MSAQGARAEMIRLTQLKQTWTDIRLMASVQELISRSSASIKLLLLEFPQHNSWPSAEHAADVYRKGTSQDQRFTEEVSKSQEHKDRQVFLPFHTMFFLLLRIVFTTDCAKQTPRLLPSNWQRCLVLTGQLVCTEKFAGICCTSGSVGKCKNLSAVHFLI